MAQMSQFQFKLCYLDFLLLKFSHFIIHKLSICIPDSVIVYCNYVLEEMSYKVLQKQGGQKMYIK